MKCSSLADGGVGEERVPTPPLLQPSDVPENIATPNANLASLMVGQQTDWTRLDTAARRIRDADYDLRAFLSDCEAACPELRLYLGMPGGGCATATKLAHASESTSGRSLDDEYQRTVGALFAVYWLMRLDIDGREGFSFGVDSQWRPIRPVVQAETDVSTPGFAEINEDEKRCRFHASDVFWAEFLSLIVDAGLLWQSAENEALEVDVDRTKAMLVLTVIHDIMKVQAFAPAVAAAHAPWGPYAAGDTIGDHDLALAYVLEKFPHLLPSYDGLPAAAQWPVLFTQGKMEFNNGWLTQAEAPPGKLFGAFRQLLRQSSPEAKAEDVSFYFVHWFTDLAGAVPNPLRGSTQFVIKFPHEVLKHFLKSFDVVRLLVEKDETTIYEEYLRMRWAAQEPKLPPLGDADGAEAVAKCRLLCMAKSTAILEAFARLPDTERSFLGNEFARTGRKGQAYKLCCGASGNHEQTSVGPALMAYYGPALLSKGTSMGSPADADAALWMLIEVYRAGRELFPASTEQVDETATLRIDVLKERSKDEVRSTMADGEVWVLMRQSRLEATVERHPLRSLNVFNQEERSYHVLSLLSPIRTREVS